MIFDHSSDGQKRLILESMLVPSGRRDRNDGGFELIAFDHLSMSMGVLHAQTRSNHL